MRVLLLLCSCLLLAACAGAPLNPPRNKPAVAEPAAREPQGVASETIVALSFSGGGLRAAAFAYGVLEGLREQPSAGGHTLLDDVGFITSVSGGSITAAYFGLHGPEGLKGFRDKVLLRDGEAGLRFSLFNPNNLMRLFAGGLNDRSNLNDWLDRDVFQGATFADLFRHQKPVVWINASNAQYRLAFPFHERAFDAICSDLASFPVSEAVAASMAVPLFFAPVVLEKFPEACRKPLPPGLTEAAGAERDDQHRLRLALLRALKDFRDPKAGRYLKLVDGGVTDNLGLVSILQSRLLLNTPYGPISEHDAATMRRMLFVVVDAGQGPSGDWGREVAGPSGVDIATAAVDTAIESTMRMSYAYFVPMMRNWERDIVTYRCSLPDERKAALRAWNPDWRCEDIKFAVTQIGFADLPEAEETVLNAIPTRLKLPAAQIDQLIDAGRRAVAQDAGVRRFSGSVQRGE
ncbi:patatin-like phospholipase family protein [Roseateles saccharophilus]|uniref:NTE family protein n=1 Tax=Roseateles saccharophilus TaxID=304 RepID=A0A4R3UPJ1_ROSSA|nr:patatin-like phospholipase family protein [Roseateles saccharophilus]MDG0833544.1 patatin-like phospholipase family protein [Roseateles saccharophilus]TCU92208.1 NTE family protein [Roseateles saccharophilus]